MYKVLLVDDEPLILDGMNFLIKWEELGLEIVGAVQTGVAALEFVDNNSVDIIITDIKMPSMNGLELIKAVKSKHSDIKIIILSGYDDFGYVKEAVKLGIENYLLKPVNDEELLSTLLLVTKKLDNETLTLQKQQQDSTIIRDNILLRWVTNTINASELESRGDLLNLVTSNQEYICCIVHCTGRPENDGRHYPERYQATIATICVKMIGKETAYVFTSFEGDIVLLFHFGMQSAGYEKMLATLNRTMQEIVLQTGLTVFFLVGSKQSGNENVHQSYTDALKLIDYALILFGSHVIEYSRTLQEMRQLDTECLIDFEMLKTLIINKDITSINRFIDELYGRLRSHNNLTPSLLRSTTMRIGVYIMNTVSMAKSISKGLPDGSDYVFASIWDKKSLHEMIEWVKDVAGMAVAFMLSADKSYSPVIKKVVQYIDANYDKEIALKCISSLLDMNAVYLGQLFKNETGQMFTVYLNNKRVEEAKKLLLSTKLNVVDIGIKVGYSNNNHFFSVFKKLMGISPTEYRRFNMNF